VKRKTVWLPRGWFPGRIGFCPTVKARKKTTESLGFNGEEPLGTVDAVTDFLEKEQVILVTLREGFEKGKSLLEVSGVLAHEAVHAFDAAMSIIHEDKPSAELKAYGIQFIYQGLFQAWWEDRGSDMDLKISRFDK